MSVSTYNLIIKQILLYTTVNFPAPLNAFCSVWFFFSDHGKGDG